MWKMIRNKVRTKTEEEIKTGRTKRLFDRILQRKGGEVDRECLVIGQEEDRRVITDGDEIGEELRQFFMEWFRHREDTWFQKWTQEGEVSEVQSVHTLFARSAEGREERERLVEVMAKEREDWTADDKEWYRALVATVPEEMHWVLELYGKKHLAHLGRHIEQEDYTNRGVMKGIGEQDWDSYWASAPANKAFDFQGLDGNMFKALRKSVEIEEGGEAVRRVLTFSIFEQFRDLLNVVIDTGMVYKCWATEVLVTLPKVAGSSQLKDIRPIGLLSVLRNAFMAIQYKGVRRTWHELGVIASTQYGCLTGLGTEGVRLVQNAAYESAWVHHSSIGGGNEDKMRAFDMPSLTMGYQAGMIRLAIPSKLVTVDEKLNANAEVRVRHAAGHSEMFIKGGEGSCLFSATQGSCDGPDKYDMFEDPLNTWWEKQPMGIRVAVSEQAYRWLVGAGYVDDKKPLAISPLELTRWYLKSSSYCAFHGAKIRPEKCGAHFAIRSDSAGGGEGRIERKADIGKVLMMVGGAMVEVGLEEADVSLKTLGELANPQLAWMEQLNEVKKLAHEVARLLAMAMVTAHAADRFWNDVFVPKVLYRLLFATVSESQLSEALSPAWQVYKRKLKLARSSPTHLLHAMGIGEIWHRIKVDRFLVLLRCLDSHRLALRETAEAMLFLEQQWEAEEQPIMSVGHLSQRGWSGTLVGDVRMWMHKMQVRVEGGKRMQKLRENDVFITSLAMNEADRALLSAGAWCLEIYRLSEVITAARHGKLRYQLEHGDWQKQLSSLKMGLEGDAEERRRAAERWQTLVARGAHRWMDDGKHLGLWMRASIRLGQFVIWWEEDTMQCGRVTDIVGGDDWEDAVELCRWTAADVRQVGSSCSGRTVRTAAGSVPEDRRWEETNCQSQRWQRGEHQVRCIMQAQRIRAVSVVVAAGRLSQTNHKKSGSTRTGRRCRSSRTPEKKWWKQGSKVDTMQ